MFWGVRELELPIHTKHEKLVREHPLTIYLPFGFNQFPNFWEKI